jgi:hypothetical protein
MELEVKLDGEEIIVTKPGTDFMLAYRKNPDRPNLMLWRSWVDIHITSPAISEFRAHAFQAAVSKARELGWIV